VTPQTKETAKRVLIGAGVGGVAAFAFSALSARRLREQFGADAATLRDHLDDRGSELRAEIQAAATRAGREAAIDALDEYGITPRFISDIQTAIQLANELQLIAIRTGKTVEQTANDLAVLARRALAP
jgi:hypothetical protein